MPYDKYITKDGKVYGPYVYHSKRVGGKVVSEYHGQTNGNTGKFFWALGILAVILLAAFFISSKSQGTGYSILGIDANYEEDLPLQGSLNFQLRDGELVPSDAEVLFENAGEQYIFPLSEIVVVQPVQGDFFVSGKSLSGSGMGFGTPGEKQISPEVSFTLLVYSLINGTEDTETEREVSGVASAGNSFSYVLEPGERAELKPLSVSINSEQAEDGTVSVETQDGIVTVSTTYAALEEGYGEDYLGDDTTNLEVDLSNLNLNLKPGQLDVSILYAEESLVSLSTVLGENPLEEQTEEDSEIIPTEEETVETINETKKEIPVASLELSVEEQAALDGEFGDITVEVAESIEKNGFIRVRYELGKFWVENSYDKDFTEDTLATLIERDKQKFKKDVARNLLQLEEETVEVTLP